MSIPTKILVTSRAAVVLGLAACGGAHGQQGLGLPPPAAGPVAPIFAGAPPPTAPSVALPRRPTTLHEREDLLDALLDDDLRDGAIDQSVGSSARMELDDIRYTEDRLRRQNHGELTDSDAFRLDDRLKRLSDIVRGRPTGGS